MKFLVKYGIGIYLIVSLLFKLGFILPIAVTNIFFYALMAGGVLAIPFYSKVIYSSDSLRVFWVLHLVNLINFVHLMLFSATDIKAAMYFFTKFSCFNLIILGLVYNADFYKKNIVKYFKYVVLFMLFTGFLLGGAAMAQDRLSIGFNANDVGLFGLLGIFSIITFNRTWHKDKKDIILISIFLLVSLLSGSRAALLGIVLVGFFNWGISIKSVGMAILFGLVMFVMSILGYNTIVDRMESQDSTFSSRDRVYDNGIKTFNDSPVFGSGLDKYGWSNPKYFDVDEPALGPHNTYISIGIMYGAFFGIIFLLILLGFMARVFQKSYRSTDLYVRFAIYFLLLIMVNGFFETLIVGVNEFVTLLFWFFIGVLSIDFYTKSEEHVPGN